MESILFALIAVRHLYKRETPLPEVEPFQTWDLQALRHVYLATGRSTRRSASRKDSPLAQAVS